MRTLPFLPLLCIIAPATAYAVPARALRAPTGLYVVACGKGKLALYWNKTPGAVAYTIYRNSKHSRQNYKRTLARRLKVADSFVGSPMKLWVDRGLVEGIEYFYTVRAVDARGNTSPPSNFDSDNVDSTAMPWDTRDAKKIIQAVAKSSSDSPAVDERIGSRDAITVMGPDGLVYERDAQGRYSIHKPSREPSDLPHFVAHFGL